MYWEVLFVIKRCKFASFEAPCQLISTQSAVTVTIIAKKLQGKDFALSFWCNQTSYLVNRFTLT